MTSSWDSFSAFNGKLTPSSFFTPAFDADSKIDYEATSASFWKWFQDLRKSPLDYGIPQERIKDVQKLLDAFFPEAPPGQRVCVRRLLSESNLPISQRKITPIQVQFGCSNLKTTAQKIFVADAPNALGYIFSIATPPALPAGDDKTFFQSYLLPLAVSYAWAIYLAFWWPPSASTPVITNVPDQVSLVYLPGGYMKFCLGSTWSGGDPPDPVSAGMRSNDEEEMDRWRSAQLLSPVFPALPRYSPSTRALVARRLNEYILGSPPELRNSSVKTPSFLEPLFTGIFSQIPGLTLTPAMGLPEYITAISTAIKLETLQPLAEAVPPDLLISHDKLGPVLMDLLYAVLDASVFADSNSTSTSTLASEAAERAKQEANLLPAIQKLLSFYLTPHLFLAPPPLPVSLPSGKDTRVGEELPPGGPQTRPIVQSTATAMPLALFPSIRNKIKTLELHLANTHESPATDYKARNEELVYFIRDTKSFARCAEGWGVYVLSRGCTTTTMAPSSGLSGMAGIRGVNVYPRALGTAILSEGGFGSTLKNGGFSAASLDGLSFRGIEGLEVTCTDPVLGPPDAEGAVLVRALQAQSVAGVGVNVGFPSALGGGVGETGHDSTATASSLGSYNDDVKAACPRTMGLFS